MTVRTLVDVRPRTVRTLVDIRLKYSEEICVEAAQNTAGKAIIRHS